jgi:hypothetical protein
MTLHRGPRNSHPVDAVAKRRHAELDAEMDLWLPEEIAPAPDPPAPCRCGAVCWRVGGEAACSFVLDPG